MSTHSAPRKNVTVPWVRSQKGGRGITMLTAYDYPTAVHLDTAGVDLLLVGDSVGTVIYGEPNTLSVTMEQMLLHTRAVTRGVSRAMVVGDLPFMSYQVSVEQAVTNAGRFLKEAGAHAVKLEGGAEFADAIAAIVRAGVPVMAHIGLKPQQVHAMGGYKMQGKTPAEIELLMRDALAVQAAGAFAVVLECVKPEVARAITRELAIPTIGIGSGAAEFGDVDGEVLVTHDLVGLNPGHVPSFVPVAADLGAALRLAVAPFLSRVAHAPEVETPRRRFEDAPRP